MLIHHIDFIQHKLRDHISQHHALRYIEIGERAQVFEAPRKIDKTTIVALRQLPPEMPTFSQAIFGEVQK